MKTFASMLLSAVVVAASTVWACEDAMSLIEAAEGYRDCTYIDTTGHKTICYGFNLDDGNAQSAIESVGGNWNTVYNNCACGSSGAGCLSQGQCQELLSSAVDTAAAGASAVFGNQCSCIQAVLTDMTYNLGEGGISSFTTFKSYIEAHQWAQASNDLYGTLWCSQVGSRCSRDAGIIAQGCGSGSTSSNPQPQPSPQPAPSNSSSTGTHSQPTTTGHHGSTTTYAPTGGNSTSSHSHTGTGTGTGTPTSGGSGSGGNTPTSGGSGSGSQPTSSPSGGGSTPTSGGSGGGSGSGGSGSTTWRHLR